MTRNCVKYKIDGFIKQFNLTVTYPNISLWVVKEEKDTIQSFINSEKAHFARILFQIINGRYNEDHYSKEPHETTAMKFKGGLNQRIYCIEISERHSKNIIMARFYASKKTTKVDKKLLPILESISNCNYNLEEDGE